MFVHIISRFRVCLLFFLLAKDTVLPDSPVVFSYQAFVFVGTVHPKALFGWFSGFMCTHKNHDHVMSLTSCDSKV